MALTELSAGPALDALIAERVLGSHPAPDATSLPPYSIDVGAAWTIVERLRAAGYAVRVQALPTSANDDDTERLHQSVCLVERSMLGVHARVGAGYAESAALAICRAA